MARGYKQTPNQRRRHLAQLAEARTKIISNKAKRADDGRVKDSYRFRAIVRSTIELVGDRHPPEIVAQLARQYAGLLVRQEQHLSELFNGDGRSMDDASYVKLVNASARILRTLGLTGKDADDDPADVDGLEKHCARRRVEIDNKRKRKDRRRERMGKSL